jgi:hypothetical protein
MAELAVFALVPEACAVLVEARSNVGPICFGTVSVEGRAEVKMSGADLDTLVPMSAVMRIPVLSLESGNSLYDSELRRRLEERRHPMISVEMHTARSIGGGRFSAEGDVTIHGTTRRLGGTVVLEMQDENTLVGHGTELIDIRDFAIPLPNMLMLKIYPDVSVQFRLTAARAGSPDRDGV